MVDEPKDAELVERCRAGDHRAFETLVYRYQGVVYHVVLRMVRDRAEARDLTQTVFLKVFLQLEAFDPAYRFSSWIHRIAMNESLNSLRRPRPSQLGDDHVSLGRDPEHATRHREREQVVQEALMQLAPDYRAVLVLRHFGGHSYEEIAQIVGVPEKTVKSRLFSARRLLRDHLESKGVKP